MVRHPPRLPGLQVQHALRDGQVRVRRDDVDMIRLDSQVVGDLANRYRSGPRQKLGQRAGVIRVEMLHQHETHARVRRQMFEQLRERL